MPTTAELREHYAKTCLAALGMSFDTAMSIPAIHKTLTRAAEDHHLTQAAHCRPLGIHHKIVEES